MRDRFTIKQIANGRIVKRKGLKFSKDARNCSRALYDGNILKSYDQLGRFFIYLHYHGFLDSTFVAIGSGQGQALGEDRKSWDISTKTSTSRYTRIFSKRTWNDQEPATGAMGRKHRYCSYRRRYS